MKNFYIIPHSHLDREWYRPFQQNRIKLVHFMDDLLDTLERDSEYTFYLLDAQTSFIDDYFEIRPERKDQFKAFVQSGRLTVGPWYVQPDEQIPSGESIIRNLLISKAISDDYGDYLHLAYNPDAFGQSANLPTIMKGFGIDCSIFYRGFAEDDSAHNDFVWEGLDGSRLLSTWMPVGYGNAMFLKEKDDEKNIQEIENNIKLLTARNISDNYLLMCGSDQSYIKKFIPETVKRLNELYKDKDYHFEIASPMKYMQSITPFQNQMDVVKGELRKGKRSRTHNSIEATRMDIKSANYKVENKYIYQLEPVNAISMIAGNESDSALIKRGWKYIVENHAHDSICCCCTDEIHKEIQMRIMFAEQIADFLMKEKLTKLHDRIAFSGKGRPILIVSSNIEPAEQMISLEIYAKHMNFDIVDSRGARVDYQINEVQDFNLKDTKVSFTPIPDDYYKKVNVSFTAKTEGAGYMTYYIVENEKASTSQINQKSMIDGRIMENEWIKVSIEEDGSLTILDKKTQQEFHDINVFADDGNAGDEYNYSPSFNDRQITSKGTLTGITVVKDTDLQSTWKLTYKMQVPEETTNERRSSQLVDLNISSYVTLNKGEERVYFKTNIRNRAKNHRIQVLFDSGTLLKKNIADTQIGEIERENILKESQQSLDDNWHEYYYPVYNQHNYAGLKDEEGNGFVIFNRGIPQYEINQEKTTRLALTLLSCVGRMGATDLKYRPGRRSGSIDMTPDSQMTGEYESEYCFQPIRKDSPYIHDAAIYNHPAFAVCYPEYSNEGVLKDRLMFASASEPVQMTAFKESEKGGKFLIRLMNPSKEVLSKVEMNLNRFLFQNVTVCNLAEETMENQNVAVIKNNNPDGSDKASFSGKVEISNFNNNSLISLILK